MEIVQVRPRRKRAWRHNCDGCWYLGTVDVKEEVGGMVGVIRADIYRCRPFVLPGRFWWSPDWSDYVCRYGSEEEKLWVYPGGILKRSEEDYALLKVLQQVQTLDEIPSGSVEAGFAVIPVAGGTGRWAIQVLYSPFLYPEDKERIAAVAIRVEPHFRGKELSPGLLARFFRAMERSLG